MYLGLHSDNGTRPVPRGGQHALPSPCHLYGGVRSTGLERFRQEKTEHWPMS